MNENIKTSNGVNSKDQPSFIFLILLVFTDIGFVLIYFIDLLSPNPNKMLSIGSDRGFPELFQYIKFSWIIILFTIQTYNKKSLQFFIWAIIFAYFLVDDAFRIHENMGILISSRFSMTPQLGLSAQNIGQIIYIALGGTIILLLVYYSIRSASNNDRKIFYNLTFLMLILIFFGFFIDIANSAFNLRRELRFLMIILEDGGEMVSVSVILWYAFNLETHKINHDYFLVKLFKNRNVIK